MRRLNERVNIKKRYCPKCISDDVKFTETLEVLESSDSKMEPVEYWLPQIKCSQCGTSAAFEAVNAMHDAACFAQKLITPEQIKNIRKKYQMNTKAFADLTGINETTIKRWESRAFFPNKADTNLIKIISTHGPDIIYDMRAEEQVETGDIATEVAKKTRKIFSEVANNDPKKFSEAAESSKQIMAFLG